MAEPHESVDQLLSQEQIECNNHFKLVYVRYFISCVPLIQDNIYICNREIARYRFRKKRRNKKYLLRALVEQRLNNNDDDDDVVVNKLTRLSNHSLEIPHF